MTVIDTTAKAQTESISFEVELKHPPEKGSHRRGHPPLHRASWLPGAEARVRRRSLRLEDDGRQARRALREAATSKRIRQTHRWVSVVFTLTVIANFIDMATRPRQPPGLVTYSPLLPLSLLLLSGLSLFVLPYVSKQRTAGTTK